MWITKALIIADILIWIGVTLAFMGCEAEVGPARQFITHEGEHYSFPRVLETLQSKTLVFEARFNETAVYNFGGPAIQSNKNKLMGFCDCNSLPHENSARFAWQWFNDRLEIYAYCYADGVREEKFVGTVVLNSYSDFEIGIYSDEYLFRLDNQPIITMRRGSTCKTGGYSKLWPYFGGHVPAPHDVIIDIRMTR